MAHQTPSVAHPVTSRTPDDGPTVLVADVGDRTTTGLFRAIPDPGIGVVYVTDRARIVSQAVALRPVAVVLPVRDTHGVTTAPLVARLRTEVPDVRAITLWNPERDRDSLVEAIRAGGELVSVSSASDLTDALRGLRRPGVLSVADSHAVRSLLEELHPSWLVEILLSAVRSAHRGLSVDQLAALVGVSRRTLGRHASDARWPAPEEIIEWGRLLRASLIQWREACSLVALAHASGFPSAQGLHKATERLLGDDAVLPGALAPLAVSAAFRRRLSELER